MCFLLPVCCPSKLKQLNVLFWQFSGAAAYWCCYNVLAHYIFKNINHLHYCITFTKFCVILLPLFSFLPIRLIKSVFWSFWNISVKMKKVSLQEDVTNFTYLFFRWRGSPFCMLNWSYRRLKRLIMWVVSQGMTDSGSHQLTPLLQWDVIFKG